MERSLVIRKISLVLMPVFALLLLNSVTNAQKEEKIRVAVVDFTKTSQKSEHDNLDKIVAEWLTTFLVETQAVEVVERRELEKLLQEQSLGQTGILEPDSAARVGKVLGVKILITGTVISVGNTVELTARLVDTTNGAIVGVASVTAKNVEALREQVKELAGIIRGKLVKASVPKDVKIFETFDESTFNTDRWSFGFDEKIKKADQENTKLTQEQGILRITGNYRKEDKNRVAWVAPNSAEPYQSIEAKIRVRKVDGGISVCLGANWNDDKSWTGICPYFEKDYGNISVSMTGPEKAEEEFDFNVQPNQWYVMRLEYKDAQFHYYWDNQLIKRITPVTPVSSPGDLHLDLGLGLEETKTMEIEVDEIILR